MPTGKIVGLYVITAAVYCALDAAWLSLASSRIYRPYLGSLLSRTPDLRVAAIFYVVFSAGIVALAIVPGLTEGTIAGALWRGALLGLMAYAAYSLTNLATIEGWAWQVSAIDMMWGTILNTLVAGVGYVAGRWLGLGG